MRPKPGATQRAATGRSIRLQPNATSSCVSGSWDNSSHESAQSVISVDAASSSWCQALGREQSGLYPR